MKDKGRKDSENEEFIKEIRAKNKDKNEYKICVVNVYNNYYNEQEYYYSIR